MVNVDAETSIFLVNLLIICVLYYWVFKPLRVLWFRTGILGLHKTLYTRSRELGIPLDSKVYQNRLRSYNALYEEYYHDLNMTLRGAVALLIGRVFKKSEREPDKPSNRDYEDLNQQQKKFVDSLDFRFLAYIVAMFATGSVPFMMAVTAVAIVSLVLGLFVYLIARIEFIRLIYRSVHRLARWIMRTKEIPYSYEY